MSKDVLFSKLLKYKPFLSIKDRIFQVNFTFKIDFNCFVLCLCVWLLHAFSRSGPDKIHLHNLCLTPGMTFTKSQAVCIPVTLTSLALKRLPSDLQ